ncbi:class I SAM-dependent methyltransferase [Streptococcus sp. SL1232]|uniref:class I SAM-dependent methyltransferase n=1 Tax=Streptococcus vicugnae TaxID=2740579 RepID=UPI0018F6C9B1|nr:class I SAM-dependent methyltransferase [Streptococcus vicugnae]MBJ7540137.1 class I SAM-dependent methyltransferase [Streptococcus vicugnae]
MTIAITTSLRENNDLLKKAQAIGEKLSLPVIKRQKQSVTKLLKGREGVLLVYETKLCLVNQDGSELVFHPDTAMLRIKSSHDALIDLLGKESLQILDTTMGLASDSIVMAYAGHDVTAVESNPLIHFIVSEGLKSYQSDYDALNQAMRSIQTVCSENLAYLKKMPDNSFDVIYCDPIFSERITESKNLDGLRQYANEKAFSNEFLKEAMRVARKKIIIKAHFRDEVFEKYGFKQFVRPNQKFHYGVIEI